MSEPTDAVIIDVVLLTDRLRLAIVDGGSERIPHIVRRRADEPSGFGLHLVQQLATEWGVARDGEGVTRVWCDLALGTQPTERSAS